MARADGSLRLLLAKLSRIELLAIDDWAMAPLSEPERPDFWEICEDCYQTRSMILTSQLPVSRWHEEIGDPHSGRWPSAVVTASAPCLQISRSSITSPSFPPVYASQRQVQNSGPTGSLLLSREAHSFSTPGRFIPARHHIFPATT
jgi:hypothetical protein